MCEEIHDIYLIYKDSLGDWKMKKVLSCLLVTVLFLTMFAVLAFADPITITDNRTGVVYEMSYRTYVDGRVSKVEYETPVSYQGRTTYYETFNEDINSAQVQKSIKECNDIYTRDLSNAGPLTSIIVPFSCLDGYVRTLDNKKNSTWILLKYFGISQNLKGTKTVTKEGIPFTFHGDGKGNIKVEIITDQIGMKTARIELPIEREHWKEESTETKYDLSYMMKPSVGVGLATGYFNTLEEALNECVEKADLSKKIRIQKITDYNVRYYAKIYDLYILEVYYGWNTKEEYEAAMKKDSEKISTENVTTKPSASKTEKLVVKEDITESTTETTVTITELESTTLGKTEANESAGKDNVETTGTIENENKNKSTLIIGVVAVVVAGAVATGVTITLKKKKK